MTNDNTETESTTRFVDLGLFWFSFRPGRLFNLVTPGPAACAWLILGTATAAMVAGCCLLGRPFWVR